MTGDKELIAMRRSGRNPDGVWFTDSDDAYSRATARDWPTHRDEASGLHAAHIRLTAEDIPDALDLRCIVGLQCHIATDRGEDRFNRIFDALMAAGASVVAGVHNGEVRFERQPAGAKNV